MFWAAHLILRLHTMGVSANISSQSFFRVSKYTEGTHRDQSAQAPLISFAPKGRRKIPKIVIKDEEEIFFFNFRLPQMVSKEALDTLNRSCAKFGCLVIPKFFQDT